MIFGQIVRRSVEDGGSPSIDISRTNSYSFAMPGRILLSIFVAQLILAASAFAQNEPATFSPAAPTQFDQIRATFTVPGPCLITESIVVNGTTIRETLLLSCTVGPPPFPATYTSIFGPLPPNTYTYEIYYDYQNGQPPVLRSQQPLVVSAAPPPIPTMSATLLVVLMFSLIAIATIALGRMT